MRDTNLSECLQEDLYPICNSNEDACVIVSKNVNTHIHTPRISIFTCPALNGPRVRDNLEDIDISYFVHDEDRKNTEKRIKLICKISARLKIDVLILGAWGCGVFCNPVYELCVLWKKYITM